MIYFLFASHCAVGCLLALALVPFRLTGGGFPRFISGVVLFFLLTSLLAAGGPALLSGARSGAAPGALLAYLGAVLPVAVNSGLKGDHLRFRAILLGAAVVAALTGFLIDTTLRVPDGAPALTMAVTFLCFLSAALAAGSVVVAMILGHFYLVIPRLSIRPLIRLCRVLLVSLGARLVFGALAFVTWGARTSGVSGPDSAPFLWQSIAVDEALIFWPRLVAGLLAPLALAFMAWRTARIRSTQSATGILYVAVVFTTIGEFLGRFLYLATRMPL